MTPDPQAKLMNSPSFDADGYPTEETLTAITTWPAGRRYDLVSFICEAWHYPERAVHNEVRATLYLSTAGWSGNESIIAALQENIIFWTLYWFKSQRGGHFWFHLKGWGEDEAAK